MGRLVRRISLSIHFEFRLISDTLDDEIYGLGDSTLIMFNSSHRSLYKGSNF